MIDYAVGYVSTAYGWLVEQVDNIFGNVSGAIPLLLGMFAVYLSARLLLRPLFGMSDGVLYRIKGDNQAERRYERVGKRIKEKKQSGSKKK